MDLHWIILLTVSANLLSGLSIRRTFALNGLKRNISKFKIVAAFYCLILLSNFAIVFLVDSTYLENNKTF